MHQGVKRQMTEPKDDVLVEIDGLSKYFPGESSMFDTVSLDFSTPRKPIRFDRSWVKAVDGVSFSINRGETFGLVGESGCGKSTLARSVLNLIKPTEGAVYFDGENITELSSRDLRSKRKNFQMVFQDPQSSLNPRMKVGKIIEAPMKAHGMLSDEGRKRRAVDLLESVGLEPYHYNRYPHEFSGGQRQRINLARALSVDPEFIVCDEPVSALDVSIQAQILNTMKDLQEEFGLTYLFIAHDLSVVRYISDRVGVMYLGNIVEIAETKELYENPQHPYTKSLLQAVPEPDPTRAGRRIVLEGEVPSPIDPPSGCRFRTRCPELIAPPHLEIGEDSWAALRKFIRDIHRKRVDPSVPLSDIQDAYFADVALSTQVEDIIEHTLRSIEDDEWEKASALLFEQIESESICSKEHPEYVVDSTFSEDEHFVACHLVDEHYG